jgi:hypothetical protein
LTDQYGNAAAEAQRTLTVQGSSSTVTIDKVNGNNLINYAEAHATGGVPLSGTVSGLGTGATFTLVVTDGSFTNSYTATVGPNGTWTASMPSSDAVMLADGSATVTTQVNGAQATQTVTVAETLPMVMINAIDNGLINAAAAAAGVSLTGSVTGLSANSTFQVTLSDGAFSKSYTATVNGAGTGWTATVSASDATALADGTATATAQVTDIYGNTSIKAVRTTAVHETLPTVTIDAIDGNDVLTTAQAQSGLTIGGASTEVVGQTVMVSLNGLALLRRDCHRRLLVCSRTAICPPPSRAAGWHLRRHRRRDGSI